MIMLKKTSNVILPLLFVCLSLVAQPVQAAIAVVAAYQPEIAALKHELTSKGAVFSKQEIHKGVTYYIGKIHKQEIILFVTGMSVVNAAMSLQMAIDRYPIDSILYSGIAGGVNPAWKTGDVVVPERWYYHDESAYFNPDPKHKGQYVLADYFVKEWQARDAMRAKDPNYPAYTNYGMIFPDAVLIIKDGMHKPEPVHYFTADPGLIAIARKAAKQLPAMPVSPERNAQYHIGGNGVTGSVFLDNREYRKWVRKVWHAEVTEMESAAVGQVATINNIPWLVIRGVSDLAGGQEGKNVENVYDGIASLDAAALLVKMLEEMGVKN